MPQILLALTCVALIAIWLLRGVPLATTPRAGPAGELWIAFCISAFPMLMVGGVAYGQPEALVGRGQLKFLLVSNTLAVTGSAMAVCFFGALGLRLALARPSPFSPEQREGKRVYRCHLGGFQLLYPKAWRMTREGLLTYVFAAKNPTLGVLRVSRVYHDSSMAKEFLALLAEAGLEAELLALDQALQEQGEPSPCYESVRPFDPERDEGRWDPQPEVLTRRVWALNRALVLFVIDYVHPAQLEGPELEAELRAVEELVDQLWVSRQVVRDPG